MAHPPERLARVTNNWKDPLALEALLASPDVTEEEIRCISRHPSPMLARAIVDWCPSVPPDVLTWLYKQWPNRAAAFSVRRDVPMALLIEMIEKLECVRTRMVVLCRLRDRISRETMTRDQVAALLSSTDPDVRSEGFAAVGGLRRLS